MSNQTDAEWADIQRQLLDERDAESAQKLCITVEQLRAMREKQKAKPVRRSRKGSASSYAGNGTGHAWAAYDEA